MVRCRGESMKRVTSGSLAYSKIAAASLRRGRRSSSLGVLIVSGIESMHRERGGCRREHIAQRPMDRLHTARSVADRRGHTLDAVRSHIAGREYAGQTALKCKRRAVQRAVGG